MNGPGLPPPSRPGLRTIELGAGSEPRLQQFFERNPLYFIAVEGAPAGPGAAHDEIHGPLPAGFPCTSKRVFGYVDADGALAAMANVVSDLLAPGVWHIGTFIVATERHGNGDAQALYRGLESWAAGNGARWMRLGVVVGNERAERFWRHEGFLETRLRHGLAMGLRTNTVRLMAKPLAGGSLDDYLAQVPRDRPDADPPG